MTRSRICAACLKKLIGKDTIEVSDLPKINPFQIRTMMQQLVDAVNGIPSMPEYYPERKENQ